MGDTTAGGSARDHHHHQQQKRIDSSSPLTASPHHSNHHNCNYLSPTTNTYNNNNNNNTHSYNHHHHHTQQRSSNNNSKTSSHKHDDYPEIINKQFVVQRRIGSGSFGVIRIAYDLVSKTHVAIKFEPLRSKFPQLLYESRLYKILHSQNLVKQRMDRCSGISNTIFVGSGGTNNSGSGGGRSSNNNSLVRSNSKGEQQQQMEIPLCLTVDDNTLLYQGEVVGVPRIYWFGVEDSYNILVMERLGPSLEDLHIFCGRQFSLKTTLMLADQILCRLQYLHSRHYIHRDLKPENLLMGRERTAHHLYLIDLGLAKKYMMDRNHHIKMRKGKSITGTVRYTSLNSHRGIEQSRRDDLESVCYLLVYFLKGSLPWQGITAATRDKKYQKIHRKKERTKPEKLCSGLPKEFVTFMYYVKKLEFDQQPDYGWMRELFINLFNRMEYVLDWKYDWDLLRQDVYSVGTVHNDNFVGEVIPEGNL